jgi:hypothetical protein
VATTEPATEPRHGADTSRGGDQAPLLTKLSLMSISSDLLDMDFIEADDFLNRAVEAV